MYYLKAEDLIGAEKAADVMHLTQASAPSLTRASTHPSVVASDPKKALMK